MIFLHHSYLIAFVGTVLSLWIGRRLAPQLGLVDIPDYRKHHHHPTPMIGGLAMFFGFMPGMLTLEGTPMPHLSRFLVAVVILIAIGVWDDRRGLRVRYRFGAEIGLSLIMAAGGGVAVHTLGDLVGVGEVLLGVLAVPFTVICVVGVVNALNMNDGVDGLAGTLALVSYLALFLYAVDAGRWEEARVILIIIAVVVAFLLFNARLPGRAAALVFMGDTGSMFLGFTLAWFTVSLTQGSHPAFTPVTALWIVAVPLIEMFGAFFRRLFKKQSPFSPDRQHLHHLLLDRGFGFHGTWLILTVVAVVFNLVGLAGLRWQIPEAVMFFGLLLLFALILGGTVRFWQRHD